MFPDKRRRRWMAVQAVIYPQVTAGYSRHEEDDDMFVVSKGTGRRGFEVVDDFVISTAKEKIDYDGWDTWILGPKNLDGEARDKISGGGKKQDDLKSDGGKNLAGETN